MSTFEKMQLELQVCILYLRGKGVMSLTSAQANGYTIHSFIMLVFKQHGYELMTSTYSPEQ